MTLVARYEYDTHRRCQNNDDDNCEIDDDILLTRNLANIMPMLM